MQRAAALAFALTLVAAVLAPGSALAQHALVGLPLTDPAYTQLEGLTRQGCAEARVSQFRPYFVGDIRKAIKEAESDSSCLGPRLDPGRD